MNTAFTSVSSGESQTLSIVPATQVEAATTKSVRTPINGGSSAVERAESGQRYHRVAEVRQQQGISLRTVSRRTSVDLKELRRQEASDVDLLLSQLLAWQKALEVPLVDLLEDEAQTLSRPVNERAKLIRIMKTAVSLLEGAEGNVRLERLAGMLRDQLIDLMPELVEIGGWPQCGTRRGPDVMGRIFHEPISVDLDSSE